jgi:hypothetical protein
MHERRGKCQVLQAVLEWPERTLEMMAYEEEKAKEAVNE